jgi:hypothetical protein
MLLQLEGREKQFVLDILKRLCVHYLSVLDACYVILQHSSLRSEAKKFLILLRGIHISQISKGSVLKAISYTFTSTIYRSLSRAPCINLWICGVVRVLGSTKADPTRQAIGTPKSSSVTEGHKDFPTGV